MLPWRPQVCVEMHKTHQVPSVRVEFPMAFSAPSLSRLLFLTADIFSLCVAADNQANQGMDINLSGAKTSIKSSAVTLATRCATGTRTCSHQKERLPSR